VSNAAGPADAAGAEGSGLPLPSDLQNRHTQCQSHFASEEEKSGGAWGRAGVQAAELSGFLSKRLQCLGLAFHRFTAALQK